MSQKILGERYTQEFKKGAVQKAVKRDIQFQTSPDGLALPRQFNLLG